MSEIKTTTAVEDQDSVNMKTKPPTPTDRVDNTDQSDADMSPTPWKIHRTGSNIGIKSADGRFVIRKAVNMLSIAQYKHLSADLERIVLAVNTAAISQPPAAIADQYDVVGDGLYAAFCQLFDERAVKLHKMPGQFTHQLALVAADFMRRRLANPTPPDVPESQRRTPEQGKSK